MSWNIVIVIVVAAAIAYFVWKQLSGKGPTAATAGAGTPPAAGAAATTTPASYEDYRRTSPSNMINGKLTCNRCGSNRIRSSATSGRCDNCGATLYGA
jgi:hypothetical protein